MPRPMGGPHGPHHIHHAPPRPHPYYRGTSLIGTGLTALVAGVVGAKIGSSIGNKNNTNNASYYEVCSFCPNCGTKRSNGATTCSNCGASLIR